MAAASSPFCSREPALVASQPLTRPGDDRVGDGIIGTPLRRCGIVKAKSRELWLLVPPVNVRDRFAGSRMLQSQRRVYQDHFWQIAVDNFQFAEPVAPKILNLDGVDTMQRPDWASPPSPPAAPFGVAQIGEPAAHTRNLFRHGQPGHSRGRPKNVWGRTVAAPRGTAAIPAPRTRPLPATCKPRPEAMLCPSCLL